MLGVVLVLTWAGAHMLVDLSGPSKQLDGSALEFPANLQASLGTFWFCLCRCSEAASPRCVLYLPSLDSFVQIPGSAGLPVQCSDLPRLAPQTNNFGALSFCSLHLTFHLSCLWPRLSPYYVIVCTWGFQEGKNQEACEGGHCANPFQMVMRNGR